jgi:hypothetical protein
MKKTFSFWFAAVVLMVIAVVFQRYTGPTYPKKVNVDINDTLSVAIKLPRSHNINTPLKIALPTLTWDWTVHLYHRPFPKDTVWIQEPPFWPENESLVSFLPSVPHKAAKIEYYIEMENITTGEVIKLPSKAPIVLRYKGSVPAWALLPHIVIMFIAMIFSNLAGFMAFFNHSQFKFWSFVTLLFIIVGGLVFGPIVQKYAFNHYWTGFPFGYDLTDNKTLIMFVFWLIAAIINLKKPNAKVTLLASIVTIIVYCIPHSLRGSEFNYETGQVVTGVISFLNGIY